MSITVNSHSLITLRLSVSWESELAHHQDIHWFPQFNVWRDIDLLPPPINRQLIGMAAGGEASAEVPPGDAVPRWTSAQLHKVRSGDFRPPQRLGMPIALQIGRHYPGGFVHGVTDVYPETITPARLLEQAEDWLRFDFNHPLAKRALHFHAGVVDILEGKSGIGGRCQDAVQELLRGPGLQARREGRPTEFFSGDWNGRGDNSPDSAFYAMPRMVNHLDTTSLGLLTELLGQLLPAGGRLLDLMASIDSHLPAGMAFASVAGLGLNAKELEANGRLDQRLIQDLNQQPGLPFTDASLDAVLCTVAVEYLTDPLAVFSEIRRVLKPGGRCIVSFSNRWFPGKAINLWPDLHEFERMGLVGEYLLRSGFGGLNTWSARGLPRPEDDPHANRSATADPLYVVWADKDDA